MVTVHFKKKKQIYDNLLVKRYYEYLDSNEWREKREKLRDAASGCCELCDEKINNKGVVHHNNYSNLFNEKEEDWQYICFSCNGEIHENN